MQRPHVEQGEGRYAVELRALSLSHRLRRPGSGSRSSSEVAVILVRPADIPVKVRMSIMRRKQIMRLGIMMGDQLRVAVMFVQLKQISKSMYIESMTAVVLLAANSPTRTAS